MRYLAHKSDDSREQLLLDHLLGTAKLSSKFASGFGLENLGYYIGLYHDIGKYSSGFQNRILNDGAKVDHSTAGAKELLNKLPLGSFCIAGHHGGLMNKGSRLSLENGTLFSRLGKELTGKLDYSVFQKEPELVINGSDMREQAQRFCGNDAFSTMFLTRMLFSCLVDADFLDTEKFMSNESVSRGAFDSLDVLYQRYLDYVSEFKPPKNELNTKRCEILDECLEAADGREGLYTLTVPTGGGKTIASLGFALKHAVVHKKARLIYVIPYTSIIEQTADVFKSIVGTENVLEHHMNVDYDKNEELTEPQIERYKLATENWEAPIIVTTNVQFFESLFTNKVSRSRKLHNIVNSVLILDEVQTLPMGFLQPIVDTLDTLKRVFNVSILFTTASQPVLSGRIEGTNPLVSFDALPQINEIIPKVANLHDRLRRVKLEIDDTPQSYDDIAEKIAQHSRVLCIVNTRKDAKEIYSRLPKEGMCFHLSRMMCPAHVRETIEMIKEALRSDSNKAIRVVATQLIEAGVDIDFPVVYRQEAGLDSILQAAGRCNREGRLELCTTHVFTLQNGLPRGFIMQTNNARKNMVGDYDWFSSKAMTEYFRQLHARIGSFDKAQIRSLLYTQELQFEEAANNFQLIDDSTTSIVVNWERKNVHSLIEHLQSEGFSYTLMKEMAQYSVNVRNNDLKILLEAGVIEEIKEGVLFIRDTDFYDEKIGLITENHWLEESLIV